MTLYTLKLVNAWYQSKQIFEFLRIYCESDYSLFHQILGVAFFQFARSLLEIF